MSRAHLDARAETQIGKIKTNFPSGKGRNPLNCFFQHLMTFSFAHADDFYMAIFNELLFHGYFPRHACAYLFDMRKTYCVFLRVILKY